MMRKLPPSQTAQAIPKLSFRDETAVSGIEFALILPFLLLLYLGGVELTQAITVDRKVTAAASSVADLFAQSPEVGSGDVNNIFNAASAIVAPYSVSPLRIVVSSVRVTDDGPVVEWSTARNATCRETDSPVHLPAEIAIPGQHVIMAEAEYHYQTIVGSIIFDGINLSERYYLRPRAAESVTANGNLPC